MTGKNWVQSELKRTATSASELTRWSWIKRLRKPYAVHSTVLKNTEGDKCNMKDTAEEFAKYLSGKHWGATEVRPPTALPKPPTVPIEEGPITGQEILPHPQESQE